MKNWMIEMSTGSKFVVEHTEYLKYIKFLETPSVAKISFFGIYDINGRNHLIQAAYIAQIYEIET